MTNDIPQYVVRDMSDEAQIDFASTKEMAEAIAAQVRSGDFDDNPRECWVDVYEAS